MRVIQLTAYYAVLSGLIICTWHCALFPKSKLIVAEGRGRAREIYPPAKMRLDSMNLAIYEAKLQLLKKIEQIEVPSGQTIKELMAGDNLLRVRIMEAVQTAPIISTRFYQDGYVEVRTQKPYKEILRLIEEQP